MYHTLLLLAAATLPSMAIAYWIYHQDHHEREPSRMLLWAFVCGCASTIPAIFFQSFFKHLENPNSLFGTAIFAFGVVGLSEELGKYYLLRRFVYPQKEFNEPIDGIVYGVMVGLGFATLENVMYVLNAGENGFTTALARAFTAVPAHASFGVLMGAYVGLAKFIPEKAGIYTIIGVGLAVFFHGAYDFFLMQQVYEGMAILAIFTLIWGIVMSRRLIRAGQEASPFKNGGGREPIVEATVDNKIETGDTKDFI
ncbi:MAG: PrsW family glutamic-type intramembrane protease [Saprospiraceae bacterium]|nr:PrsW family glutamic-type intramembrane protease [Saprospiraceae bacterium]